MYLRFILLTETINRLTFEVTDVSQPGNAEVYLIQFPRAKKLVS